MKKVIVFGLASVLMLTSCSKEKENCNCGVITDDGITYNNDGSYCYWLEVRNNCSDRKKQFCFDYDIWFNANIGEDFCVTNEISW